MGKFKKIWTKIVWIGSNLDKVAKILFVIPGMKAWSIGVGVVDTIFDLEKKRLEKENNKAK